MKLFSKEVLIGEIQVLFPVKGGDIMAAGPYVIADMSS